MWLRCMTLPFSAVRVRGQPQFPRQISVVKNKPEWFSSFCVSLLRISLSFPPLLWPHLFSPPSTARALIQYCRRASTGRQWQTMQKRQGNQVQGKQAVDPHESSRLETTRRWLTLVDTKAVVRPKTQRWCEPSQHRADLSCWVNCS